RPDAFGLVSSRCIRSEVSLHVTGANGQDLNAGVRQFASSSLADRIHGEFRSAVNPVKGNWNMPGHAGDVDDGARTLLLHDRDDGLHGFHHTEEIGFEGLAAVGHAYAGD